MRIARRDFNTYGPDAGYLLTGVPAVETVIDGGKNVWLLLASTNPAVRYPPWWRALSVKAQQDADSSVARND